MKTPCSNPACGHVDDSDRLIAHVCPQPRLDLLALFDAFAALPPGHASLSLFGNEQAFTFRAWAAELEHRIEERPMQSPTQGHWTILALTLTSGWISVHVDEVTRQVDEGMIAQVQAVLDGEQPETEGSI